MTQWITQKFQLEKNYTIFEKELFSVYLTLNSVHPVLVGYTGVIHIYCDNQSIVKVLNKPLDNSHFVNRAYKWLNFIRSFNYNIVHIDGKKNVIADALSRCYLASSQAENFAVEEVRNLFRQSLDPTFTVSVNATNINNEPNSSYKGFHLDHIVSYLKTLSVPAIYANPKVHKRFTYRALEFYLQNGILFKRGKEGSYSRRVLIGSDAVRSVFFVAHDKRGHLGIEACFNLLNCYAFIPNLYRRLKDYITTCIHCQKQGPATNQRDPLYFNLPAGLFHTIVCDCVKIGGSVIVVARDEFLAWAEAKVLPRLTAEAVAEFIYEAFIARFGTFQTLKTDNGPEFANKVLKQLLLTHGIEAKYTVPYHPQGNGMIEASHKSIIHFMRLFPEKVNLEQALVTALWVDRTTVRKRTGFTPQYLVYGFEGHSPLVNLIRHSPDIRTYSEDELFLFRFQQLYHRQHQITSALDTQRRTREHHKEVFDNR